MRYILGVIAMLMLKVAWANNFDLVNFLDSIHSMRANFVQTSFDKRHKPIQRQAGEMALQRPGKFRWQIKEPEAQLIIANNNKLYIFDPDLAQLTIRPLASNGDVPGLLLSEKIPNIERKFTITANQHADGSVWFKLVPKQSNESFSAISLGFKDHALYAMELVDNFDNITKIDFSAIKLNADLPDPLFLLKPPANVDVIDETHAGT